MMNSKKRSNNKSFVIAEVIIAWTILIFSQMFLGDLLSGRPDSFARFVLPFMTFMLYGGYGFLLLKNKSNTRFDLFGNSIFICLLVIALWFLVGIGALLQGYLWDVGLMSYDGRLWKVVTFIACFFSVCIPFVAYYLTQRYPKSEDG